jgi:hypothetical protein
MFDKRYQVFVSSTLRDLEEERQAVFRQLQKMNHIPAGMEIFTAMDEQQFIYIKRIIDRSDYYVLILGARYGSLTDEGISFTEAEFDYAKDKGVPILAFLHRKPEEIPQKFTEVDPRLARKLEAFRKKASGSRMVEHWENKDQLAAHVGASLSQAISLYPRVGWVRGDQVASTEVLTQLNLVRQENDELRHRLAELGSRLTILDLADLDQNVNFEGYYFLDQIT